MFALFIYLFLLINSNSCICVLFTFSDIFLLGNLRNDDEGTTTTLYIRERLDRGFGFRRKNLKVKRTIVRKDDGISGHYKFCFSMAFKD